MLVCKKTDPPQPHVELASLPGVTAKHPVKTRPLRRHFPEALDGSAQPWLDKLPIYPWLIRTPSSQYGLVHTGLLLMFTVRREGWGHVAETLTRYGHQTGGGDLELAVGSAGDAHRPT